MSLKKYSFFKTSYPELFRLNSQEDSIPNSFYIINYRFVFFFGKFRKYILFVIFLALFARSLESSYVAVSDSLTSMLKQSIVQDAFHPAALLLGHSRMALQGARKQK